jgi:hypothetical protein
LQLPYAIEKSVFTVMTVLKFGVRFVLLTAGLTLLILAVHAVSGSSIDSTAALQGVITNPWYQVVVFAIAGLHVRLILFRMADKTRTL